MSRIIEKIDRHLPRRQTAMLLAFSISLLAFVTYRDVLGYYFTASDTFTLIETSRIQSAGDMGRIFSEPLMSGTFFAKHWKYYRPIVSLSFGIDYAVWELDPFGYHLTNLSLHIIVCVLVFYALRAIFNGKNAAAWLGAAAFAVHPILVENIPAVARRHDTLAAMFMLGSLLAFFGNASRSPRPKWLLPLSLFFYALALCAKEIAVILPVLIFSYSVIAVSAEQEESLAVRAIRGVKEVLPHLAATVVILGWRTYVLRGLGGYMHSPENLPNSPGPVDILNSYVLDLLYPVDFLRIVEGGRAPYFSAILLLAVCAAGTCLYAGIKDRSSKIEFRNSAAFLLTWICLPLGVYLATRTFEHRSMYISVIPLCAMLSLMLTQGLRSVVTHDAEGGPPDARGMPTPAHAAAVILTIALLFSFLSYSPLFRNYGEWKDSGKISAMYLQKLSEIFPMLPADAVIHAYRFPRRITGYENQIPHARSVSYLGPTGIKAWLDLNYPANRAEIWHRSTVEFETCPADFTLRVQKGEGGAIAIVLEPLAF